MITVSLRQATTVRLRRLRHCTDIGGCERERLHIPRQRHELCRALHAEQNAIIQAAKVGEYGGGDDLYYFAALRHLSKNAG